MTSNRTPQTIAFTGPGTGNPGGTATLSATATSGLPVSFSVDATSTGICSVSGTNGDTVTYAAAGNCVIDSNQPGNGTYAAAPQVSQTVVVGVVATRTPQTIAFTGPGTGNPGGTATLSATATSGLPVSFSVDATSTG
ncbi:MAG: hypothetical protein ACRD0E_09425, partial [Acidimicrobiales bacterium]